MDRCRPLPDPDYAGAARTLATATGHLLITGSITAALAHSLTEPVTVLADVRTVTPELLAAVPEAAQLGLLPMRDPSEAADLVDRNVAPPQPRIAI